MMRGRGRAARDGEERESERVGETKRWESGVMQGRKTGVEDNRRSFCGLDGLVDGWDDGASVVGGEATEGAEVAEDSGGDDPEQG